MSAAFGATAYVSYARKDEARVQVVSQLRESCADGWVYLKVDEDEVKPRESFEAFINEIGAAGCVIVIFSESYLSSFYCMLELTRIVNDVNKHDGVLKYAYPVFAEDGFRLDGVRQKWKNFWQAKFDSWQCPEEVEEVTDAYGSEAECQEILNSLDLIFDTFSRNLAGQAPDCNPGIIEWVKGNYFQRIQRNPVFNKSIAELKACHGKTQQILNTVVERYLDDSGNYAGELAGEPEKLIPYLVQLPIPELLTVFDQAQEFTVAQTLGTLEATCLQELSYLLQLLIPLLFQPEAVSQLQASRLAQEPGIICIPCASDISAEILMAGVDKRATDFGHIRLDSGQTKLIPKTYCLPLPPEAGGGSGNIQSGLDDVASDLSQRMGLSVIDDDLFNRFVKDEGVSPENYHEFVRQELEFLMEDGKPGYYWLFNVGATTSPAYWTMLADRLSQRYPEILLLSLDTSKKLEERKLLRLLHKVVPRHLI